MNSELSETLQQAQKELDPQLRALKTATSALKTALRLANEERADALPMQKALLKLQQANELLDNETLQRATDTFGSETEEALGALAFDFAQNLKETFEARGIEVEGRPPTLVVDPLVLHIDTGARKAQWFYGKEALTRPLALSLGAVTKAYDQQQKRIVQREVDAKAFLEEIRATWQELLEQRSKRPPQSRINLIEVYSKLVLNRQATRFWNAPSRSTFKDFERPLFVRDLVLALASPERESYNVRLGVATKSQADSPSRSLWVPRGALEGEYYSDITFGAG